VSPTERGVGSTCKSFRANLASLTPPRVAHSPVNGRQQSRRFTYSRPAIDAGAQVSDDALEEEGREVAAQHRTFATVTAVGAGFAC
jgi:hypothetical protein